MVGFEVVSIQICNLVFSKTNTLEIDKQIPLRPRFEKVVPLSTDKIFERCEKFQETLEPEYKVKISEMHIWIHIGMLRREKYSPHLHLELDPMEDGNTHVRGLYGPDPVLWTLFMFLHFVVAGIFIIFGAIAYSKWMLNQPNTFDIMVMITMTIVWLLLYFIARYNRSRGISQARELEKIMEDLLVTA